MAPLLIGHCILNPQIAGIFGFTGNVFNGIPDIIKIANNQIEIFVLNHSKLVKSRKKWPVPEPSGKSENLCTVLYVEHIAIIFAQINGLKNPIIAKKN